MVTLDPCAQGLRALRDCSVIRVRIGAVPSTYKACQRAGFLSSRRADEGYAHIRLNAEGEAAAAAACRP